MNEYVKKSLKIGGLLALCGALFSGGLICGYSLSKSNSKQVENNSSVNIKDDKPNNIFKPNTYEVVVPLVDFKNSDFFLYTYDSILEKVSEGQYFKTAARIGLTQSVGSSSTLYNVCKVVKYPNPAFRAIYFYQSSFVNANTQPSLSQNDLYLSLSLSSRTTTLYGYNGSSWVSSSYASWLFTYGIYMNSSLVDPNAPYLYGIFDGYRSSIYNSGYTAGETAGYKSGQSDGYNTGYSEGYGEGEAAGYTGGRKTGYSDGYTAGTSDGYNTGYTAGTSDGYNTGYTAGTSDGYNTGYTAGTSDGYNTGYTAGESDGYTAGESGGYITGYSDGYTSGYNTGYEDAGGLGENEDYLYKIDFQDNINKYAPFGVYSDYFILNNNKGTFILFEGLFEDSLKNQYKKITITYAQGEGTKYGDNSATLKTMPEGSLLFMYISFIDNNDNEIVACYPVYKNREGGTYYTLETTWRSSAFQHLTILEDNTNYDGAVFRSFDNSQTALSSFNSGATGVQKQTYTTGPFALLSSAFSAVASIMSIQLFPGLTLGLLFFLPLIAGIIIAIIWIVKR